MTQIALNKVLNGIINREPLFIPFQQVCGKVLVKQWNTCGIVVSNCGNYVN